MVPGRSVIPRICQTCSRYVQEREVQHCEASLLHPPVTMPLPGRGPLKRKGFFSQFKILEFRPRTHFLLFSCICHHCFLFLFPLSFKHVFLCFVYVLLPSCLFVCFVIFLNPSTRHLPAEERKEQLLSQRCCQKLSCVGHPLLFRLWCLVFPFRFFVCEMAILMCSSVLTYVHIYIYIYIY